MSNITKNSKKKRPCIKCNAKFVCILCAIVILFGTIVCAIYAIGRSDKEEIVYRETSTVDYKVYLKDNSFYDTPYLGDGMAYVASLIDKIYIDYDYSLIASAKSNIDVNYKIVAKLTIGSQNSSNVFFEKSYDLTDSISDKMVDTNMYHITRQAVIDYNYYNNLANEFRASYAVNTVSRLDVEFIIEEKNNKDNDYVMNNRSMSSLTIPLSEQEVSIAMQENQVNDVKKIIKEAKYYVKNKVFFIIGIVLVAVLTIQMTLMIICLLRNRNKSSKYEKYIKRLLTAYDRIIVNVKTPHNKDKYEVIHINSFEELVDVRDNTKEHINYYIIEEHKKCEFYVTNDNDLYLYEVDAKDFDGKKK